MSIVKLSTADRIGTAVAGVGLIAMPIVKGVDHLAFQIAVTLLGLVLLVVGGLGGT